MKSGSGSSTVSRNYARRPFPYSFIPIVTKKMSVVPTAMLVRSGQRCLAHAADFAERHDS